MAAIQNMIVRVFESKKEIMVRLRNTIKRDFSSKMMVLEVVKSSMREDIELLTKMESESLLINLGTK